MVKRTLKTICKTHSEKFDIFTFYSFISRKQYLFVFFLIKKTVYSKRPCIYKLTTIFCFHIIKEVFIFRLPVMV